MKHIYLAITLLAFSLAAHSQHDSSVVAPTSTLTLGVSIVNNADYYGQRSQERMPYTAIVASYRHRSGFYMNALSYRLLSKGVEGFGSAYGGGIGYDIDLAKHWLAELGYQYTFFPMHSPFLQAANPHTTTASLSWQSAVSITLDGNYSFGKTNDFFSTLAVSKEISLLCFTNKAVVNFTPQLSLAGGTQKFYNYYLTEKTIRDSLAGKLLDPIFGGRGATPADTTTFKVTRFDLLSYNVKLPVSYARANYMIELSTQLSLLSKQSQVQPGKLNTFFSASFYYQF